MAQRLARVNTHVYGSVMDDRLTKADWIDHGLRTLATDGANALKVGPMAAKLNVSRGSFYWHFKDIGDFRAQLLQAWLDRTTEAVIRQLETGASGPDRLRSLLHGAFVAKPAMDRATSPWAAEDAIRAWAAEDAGVAAMVASVDDRRVAYIAGLLAATGLAPDMAHSRAAFLYWAYLGQGIVMDRRHASLSAAQIDAIAALFEA